MTVNIMHREEAWNVQPSRCRGNQSGHPIITMNQIGIDGGDDVVDDLALECKGDFFVGPDIIRVDFVAVVEAAILSQMNACPGELVHVDAELLVDELSGVYMEHASIVRKRNMDIGPKFEQGRYQ